MAPENLRRTIFIALILLFFIRLTISDQRQVETKEKVKVEKEEKPEGATEEDEDKQLSEIKTFLRQPAYIILIVIFILIFIAMWFVPDLPPHGTKKTKK